MKAIEQYFITLYKVVLSFKSSDIAHVCVTMQIKAAWAVLLC